MQRLARTNVQNRPATEPGARRSQERRILVAFSRGELGREAATKVLALDYRGLLDRLAAEGIPLFRVAPDIAERMSDGMVAILAPSRS